MTKSLIATALLASFVSLSAVASETPATSTASAPRFIDKITLGYTGVWYGPSVGKPSIFQPDVDTGGLDFKSPQAVDNVFTLGYKLNDNDKIAINDVLNIPVRGSFTLSDPYVTWSRGKIYTNGGFTFGGDLRAYLPVTPASSAGHLITGIRFSQSYNYDLPGSRWSVGGYSYVKYSFYGANRSGTLFKTDINPGISYRWNEKLSPNFYLDVVGKSTNESGFAFGKVGLSAGMEWDISPKFILIPAINVTPSNLTLTTTQFSMLILASIL